MADKHPTVKYAGGEIEQAIRLLVRAAVKLKPHGLLICKLEWHPTPKRKKRNKA